MNRQGNFRFVLLFGFVLSLAGVLLGQGIRDRTLVVNGRSTAVAVRQMDGHSYIDLDALA